LTNGWIGAPAACNSQSAPYQVRGHRFELVDYAGTTLIACGGDESIGYIDAITSWGIADDDRLYLLDRNDRAIFVARPLGEPGCIVRRSNTVRIDAHGERGCDTSDMDNDLRDQ
jgi:hypothetical protein